MRERTLAIILFIILIPDIALIVTISVVPATVHYISTDLASRLASSMKDQAYGIVVYGAFVYAVVVGSILLYLVLSAVTRRFYLSDNVK